MTDFLAEDLPTMFEDFGESVVYDPEGPERKELKALVDLSAEENDLVEGEFHLTGFVPMITVMTSLLPTIKKGDLFEVRGESYKVRKILPDNEGERDIILERR